MATVAESAMNGLDPMFQPDWFLTPEQVALLERLKEICEETIRPLAAENDRTLTFPRKSLEALAPDGFLGLMLPKEWGGLGQNHVMYANVTETIARYGDASCAMCYVMHIGAVEALKLRATDFLIDKYLSKVREGLIGTLSYSDPETGSHFWYPIASGRAPRRRRLRGAEEGVLDDLRRLRRLLRPADDLAGLQRRLLEPVGVRRRQGRDRGQAGGVGRDGPARQPVRHAAPGLEARPREPARRHRSATAPSPTTSRSTRTS